MIEEACSIALDQMYMAIRVWESIQINFTSFLVLRLVMRMQNWKVFGSLARSYITSQLAFVYEVATTFLLICKETKEIELFSAQNTEWKKKIIEELDNEITLTEQYISAIVE
jgi:hypothetical protein